MTLTVTSSSNACFTPSITIQGHSVVHPTLLAAKKWIRENCLDNPLWGGGDKHHLLQPAPGLTIEQFHKELELWLNEQNPSLSFYSGIADLNGNWIISVVASM